MITIIRHNLMRKKSVLFITHEGRPDDIMTKVWCSMTGLTKDEIYLKYKTEEGRRILDKTLAYIKTYLTYIPMNRAGLTVEDVEIIVRKKQEERLAQTGKYYDMVADDYPAKLITNLARNGSLQKRNMDEYVYNQFVQLGLEYNSHQLLVIQTNREGSKINKGKEDRLLQMEDVNESFGVMQLATNVITINRDDLAEANSRMTFYLAKCRSNEKGYAVVCRSDYSRSVTHSDSYGYTSYRGCATLSDKVDDLIKQYENRMIPSAAIPF